MNVKHRQIILLLSASLSLTPSSASAQISYQRTHKFPGQLVNSIAYQLLQKPDGSFVPADKATLEIDIQKLEVAAKDKAAKAGVPDKAKIASVPQYRWSNHALDIKGVTFDKKPSSPNSVVAVVTGEVIADQEHRRFKRLGPGIFNFGWKWVSEGKRNLATVSTRYSIALSIGPVTARMPLQELSVNVQAEQISADVHINPIRGTHHLAMENPGVLLGEYPLADDILLNEMPILREISLRDPIVVSLTPPTGLCEVPVGQPYAPHPNRSPIPPNKDP